MPEDEYIQLQNLLIKYRVYCFKQFGDVNLPGNIREVYRKQINCIDKIRNKLPLDAEGRENLCLKD